MEHKELFSNTDQLPEDNAPMIEWALFYASLGIEVFPIQPGKKDSYYRYSEYASETSEYSWQTQASCDPERVKKFWTDHPNANIGAATGSRSNNIYVLDFDPEQEKNGKIIYSGLDRLAEFEDKNDVKLNTDTWTAISGSKGAHYFYLAQKDKFLDSSSGASHIFGDDYGNDTRGDGNYIILPPSTHPNGNKYMWEIAPGEIELAEADDVFYKYWIGEKPSKDSTDSKNNSSISFDELKGVYNGRHVALYNFMSRYIAITKGKLDVLMYEDFLNQANNSLPVPIGQGDKDKRNEYQSTVLPMVRNILAKEYKKEDIDYSYGMKLWQKAHPRKKFNGEWEEVKKLVKDNEKKKTSPNVQTEENLTSELLKKQKKSFVTGSEYVDKFLFQEIEELEPYRDIKTGFDNLDNKADGLFPGVYTLCAGSSWGKTTFCLQMADQLAKQGHEVAYFSYEQSHLELVSKSLARELETDMCILRKIKKFIPKYSAMDIIKNKVSHKQALSNAITRYKGYASHLHIVECNFGVDIEKLFEGVQYIIKKTGKKPIVFIDYIQIVSPVNVDASDKATIDYTIKYIKSMQQKLKLVIIAISSIAREKYTEPISMDSAKESGGIDYTANVIWGLQPYIMMDSKTYSGPISKKKELLQKAKKGENGLRHIQLKCVKNRFGVADYSCGFLYDPAVDTYTPDPGYADFIELLRLASLKNTDVETEDKIKKRDDRIKNQEAEEKKKEPSFRDLENFRKNLRR